MTPSSLDCSRTSNGPGSHQQQHSTGYSNDGVSPHRQQLWSNNSNRKSHYAASTCSESSVERKSEKKDSRSHKQISDHQSKESGKRKLNRTSLERHRYKGDLSPQVSSSRQHLRETVVSASESSHIAKSTEAGSGSRGGAKHASKGKLAGASRSFDLQQKTPTLSTCSSNGETLSKLQRERVELLLKLNMLQTQHKTGVSNVSSARQSYNGYFHCGFYQP